RVHRPDAHEADDLLPLGHGIRVLAAIRRHRQGQAGAPPPHLDRDRVRGVATRHAREVLPRYHRVTVDLADAATRPEARLDACAAGGRSLTLTESTRVVAILFGSRVPL